MAKKDKKTAGTSTKDKKDAGRVNLRRYDRAWRAGIWLFGPEAEQRVPFLQGRAASKRKKSATGDATPAVES